MHITYLLLRQIFKKGGEISINQFTLYKWDVAEELPRALSFVKCVQYRL